ncbi:small glutamine-rich tetratricopeptide repeat-containing protein beta [Sigmodon hispidus]
MIKTLETKSSSSEVGDKIDPSDLHVIAVSMVEFYLSDYTFSYFVLTVPFIDLIAGNNHMKEENYTAAVDCYTQAIELDPNNAVYYCNRAAAQSKLSHYKDAIKDCERAIAIDSKYSKAYGRMGLALTAMNKFEEAVTSYQKALDLDPENDSYKSNLKIAEQKLREVASPAASLMQNPQVQQL